MSDEARSMWERFITAPKNAALLKRYAKSAKEPAPLFESIGEDLASSNEEVRKTAFWALVTAMPELTNILHERETRQPGWRDVEGKDQQMVNRGSDILTDLHRVLVKKHRFRISDRYGKDPRPYVNTAISNWEEDERRKRTNRDGTLREVPLDYEAALEIPDPAGSPEDSVLENIAYEERKKELLAWGFPRSREELDLLETVHVDERPLDEIRERYGIPSEDAVRKRLSRTNKNIVAERDALFTFLLIGDRFAKGGKLPRLPQDPERSEEWAERVKRSVRPGVWLNGVAADGKNEVALRALTTGLRHAPGHIYLVAIHKGYYYDDRQPLAKQLNGLRSPEEETLSNYMLHYVEKLFDPTGWAPQRLRHTHSSLDVYPTELPGLNDALAEVRDDYNTWLISNSLPSKSYRFWVKSLFGW
jgi:DNA-directed RNA polymerase specialized sigma24 family protein